MRYKLRYLETAMSDIQLITQYLSSFYPSTAAKFLDALEEQLKELETIPNLGERYHPKPEYRKLIVSGYLVFYKVIDSSSLVEIHRILRGSWDIKKHL